MQKKAFYKVYSSDFTTYITTWNVDVVSTPSFNWSINGSMGQMQITLARSVTDFGETEDVALFNYVEAFVQDIDAVGATQIYSGIIASYRYSVSPEGKNIVNIYLLSVTEQAKKLIAKDGSGNTTLTYNSYEPADIMRSLLNRMNGILDYNADSIDNTGTTVSYEYAFTTFLDAIKKVVELCPAYWYWYVDPNNLVHLHSTDFDTINHSLYLGRELQAIDVFKTVEEMYNTVYFLGKDSGSGNLYKKYTSGGSITQYGSKEYMMSDLRVSDANTAETMATKFLNEYDHFNQEVSATIIDNNGEGSKGYDIESLRPGQVVEVFHPQIQSNYTLWYSDDLSLGNFIWDVSFWNYDIRFSLGVPMQIQEIQYNFHTAIIKLSTTLPNIAKRIEDIDRNLLETQSTNVPSIPS